MTDKITFLSYSRKDSEFALKLTKDLRQTGLFIWLDQIDIPPGKPFDREIEKILRESSSLLILLSPDSVNSENVQDEISYALKTKKRIIPLMYKKCDTPYRIERLQFIDFTKDYKNGFNTLSKTLAEPSPLVLTPEPPKALKQRNKFLNKSNIVKICVLLMVMVIIVVNVLRETQTQTKKASYMWDSLIKSRQYTQTADSITEHLKKSDTSKTNIKKESAKIITNKSDSIVLLVEPVDFSEKNDNYECDAHGIIELYQKKLMVTLNDIKIKVKKKDKVFGLSIWKDTIKDFTNLKKTDNIIESTILKIEQQVSYDSTLYINQKVFIVPFRNLKAMGNFTLDLLIYITPDQLYMLPAKQTFSYP